MLDSSFYSSFLHAPPSPLLITEQERTPLKKNGKKKNKKKWQIRAGRMYHPAINVCYCSMVLFDTHAREILEPPKLSLFLLIANLNLHPPQRVSLVKCTVFLPPPSPSPIPLGKKKKRLALFRLQWRCRISRGAHLSCTSLRQLSGEKCRSARHSSQQRRGLLQASRLRRQALTRICIRGMFHVCALLLWTWVVDGKGLSIQKDMSEK